jgi:hypothetical protein
LKLLTSATLGGIHLVRVYNMLNREPVEKTPDTAPPEGLDWDLWVGPGPLHPCLQSTAAVPEKPRAQTWYFSKHLQWLNWEQMAETAAELGFDGIDAH